MTIRWRHIAAWTLFLGVMLLLPNIIAALGLKKGLLRTITWAQFLAIFAMSWDFLSGRTGYISFGHPFLIGIGAYTTGILSRHFGVPVEASIPIAVVVTVVGSIFFVLPALRVRGSYFALVTLAFMELMYQLTQVIRPDLTGGTRGLSRVETLTRGAEQGYYMSFALMFGVAVLLWTLNRTRLGTALSAIGQNEDAVSGSGLNPTKLKIFAFSVSAAVAGLGGAFLAHYQGYVSPRGLFDITFVFSIIVAALIGGAGTIVGPIIGAFFLTLLLENLRVLTSPSMIKAEPLLAYLEPALRGEGRFFIYGVVALVVYMVQPKGIHAMIAALGGRRR